MKGIVWSRNQSIREAEDRLTVAYSGNSEEISRQRSYHQDRAWSNRRPSVQPSEMPWFTQHWGNNSRDKNEMCWKKFQQLRQLWNHVSYGWSVDILHVIGVQRMPENYCLVRIKYVSLKAKLRLLSPEYVLTLEI